jgi:hypothetical protein
MKRILIAALLPATLAVAGCGSFNVEAEQPQVCLQLVTPQAITVNPPAPIPGGRGTLTATVDLGLSDAIPKEILQGSPSTNVVTFLSATIALQSAGRTSAPWLTSLKVTAVNGSQSVVLADYTPTTAPTTASFTLQPSSPGNNIVTLLQDGGLKITVEAGYDPLQFPTGSTWSAGVAACFSAKVKKYFNQF